ncbi:MAG: hypothetical protein RIR53_705 [Bacteroidota bacterium]|jgi:rhodanese-related sulfurtransferase
MQTVLFLALGKLGIPMLTALVATILIVTCCSPIQEGADLTVKQAVEMVRKDTSLILVDVRTPEEYHQGHIRGSRLMNYYEAGFHSQLETLPKDKHVIFYCRTGRRSAEAREYLSSIGYSRVHNMLGGINAWKKDRQPVIEP